MNPRSADRLETICLLVLGLSVLVSLATAVALVFFAHPLGDDWCHAADVRELGWRGCVESYYVELSGRWPGWAVSCGILAGADAVPAYRLALLALIGLEIFALWLLTTTVLSLSGRSALGCCLAATLFALHWAGMPDPGQTVYWLEGAIAYSLSLSLSIVIVSLLLRLPAACGKGCWVAVCLLVLLGLVTAALQELIALTLTGVLLAGTAICILRSDARGTAWACVAAGVLVGFATLHFSPGNEARVAMGDAPREANVVAKTALATTRSLVQVLDQPVSRGTPVGNWGRALGWVLDARLLAALLLLATARTINQLRPAWLEHAPRLWRAVLPAIWLAALVGCFVAGNYGAALGGLALPARAYNAIYLVFLLGAFLTAFVHSRWDMRGDHPGIRILRAGSAGVLALGLLFSTSLKLGARDLATGEARSFDRQIARRHQAALRASAAGIGELVVPRIDPWPESYFRAPSTELKPDPTSHHNECAARYFGVPSIRLGSAAP